MTASTSMSVFCQWLMAEPARKSKAFAIALHGNNSIITERFIHELAEYLNEYDDDADGLWLNATQELVQKVASDSSQRRLLGIEDPQSPSSDSDFYKTLSALVQRGHVVYHSPAVAQANLKSENTFHAGIGNLDELGNKCHITLNPHLIEHNCIPHIIGDVFLEWLNCENHKSPTSREVEQFTHDI